MTRVFYRFGRKRYQMKRYLMGYNFFFVKNILLNVNYRPLNNLLLHAYLYYVWSMVDVFFVTHCVYLGTVFHPLPNKVDQTTTVQRELLNQTHLYILNYFYVSDFFFFYEGCMWPGNNYLRFYEIIK